MPKMVGLGLGSIVEVVSVQGGWSWSWPGAPSPLRLYEPPSTQATKVALLVHKILQSDSH